MVDSEYRGFALLREAAKTRVERTQNSLMRLIFKTGTEIDPLRVEYDRGFSQGVAFALEGLPNEIYAEWLKTKESDPSA